ncbi:hypothetical protein [Streptomyces sp. NPDC057838]|uniref:hypothetical protein n=1 Tax=unclassified Streptomyces TaxID=2593676 RepID=UPI0036C68D3B
MRSTVTLPAFWAGTMANGLAHEKSAFRSAAARRANTSRCRAASSSVGLPQSVHHVGEPGDEAIQDRGRVHDCFHEFVLINRPVGRITLIVAADD